LSSDTRLCRQSFSELFPENYLGSKQLQYLDYTGLCRNFNARIDRHLQSILSTFDLPDFNKTHWFIRLKTKDWKAKNSFHFCQHPNAINITSIKV
jgi:hypothetical protein